MVNLQTLRVGAESHQHEVLRATSTSPDGVGISRARAASLSGDSTVDSFSVHSFVAVSRTRPGFSYT